MTFTRVVTAAALVAAVQMPMDMMMIGGGDPNGTQFWAQADVPVDGTPVSGVTLALQPGMTITGKVEFRSVAARPRRRLHQRVSLNMTPVATGGGCASASARRPCRWTTTGKFTIAGVTPGRYRINGSAPSTPTPGSGPAAPWRLGSAVVKGRDILDFPLDVAPGDDITGAVVTFTDATQEISGSLQDASGRPAPDYTIVVFAADKATGRPSRAAIRTARPATDGKFTVTNLPPGDYRMAAVVDSRRRTSTIRRSWSSWCRRRSRSRWAWARRRRRT